MKSKNLKPYIPKPVKEGFIISLLILNYCMLILSFPILLGPGMLFSGINTTWQQSKHHGGTSSFVSGGIQGNRGNCTIILDSGKIIMEADIWDPGPSILPPDKSIWYSNMTSVTTRLTRSQRNKLAHITYGNRSQRGKGISCLYWNKGPSFLINKQNDLETIIADHKPHILGLGEANFRHDQDKEAVQIQGYNLHIDSGVENPDVGGMARVAVYTHNLLRVKRRPDLEDRKIAAVWLECGLPRQKGMLVCIGYRQWRLLGQQDSSSSSVSEQLARWLIFLDKWETALGEEKEVIVMMDANLDFLTWRDNEDLPNHHSSNRLKCLVDALFDRILPLGVSQMVTGATRMQRGQPQTGLDHVYTNKPEKLSSIQTLFTGMSDHKLLKMIRYSKSFKQSPRYFKKRIFKNFKETQFKQKLSQCKLSEVLECYDVDAATEKLVEKITKILDELAPIKTIQTRTNYAPWLSKDTKDLKKQREAAQEKAARTNNQEDWRNFTSLRNQVTAKKREDKKKWKEKKLDPTQNSCTDTWKTVKGWLGWGSGGPPTQLFYSGRIVTQPAGLSSSMNRFFIDKVKDLRNRIPIVNSDPLKKLKEAMQYIKCKFQLKPVTVDEVTKLIKGLKSSNATGVDYIDTRTIKLGVDLLAPAITHIINLSIRTSTFPKIWKWHKVIPLLKATSCDPLIPKSYKPVALLTIFSKILQKAVFSQLVQYLEENGLIHPNLHGSRAGHSTATALTQMYDTGVEQVEDGKMVGVLICDQSAAFDLCDHYLLVEKLRLMGLDEQTLTWIWSYLSGRKQSCMIDGQLSAPLELPPCGVPQGSIGGPLLWLVFTCDQPDAFHEHSIDGPR